MEGVLLEGVGGMRPEVDPAALGFVAALVDAPEDVGEAEVRPSRLECRTESCPVRARRETAGARAWLRVE